MIESLEKTSVSTLFCFSLLVAIAWEVDPDLGVQPDGLYTTCLLKRTVSLAQFILQIASYIKDILAPFLHSHLFFVLTGTVINCSSHSF